MAQDDCSTSQITRCAFSSSCISKLEKIYENRHSCCLFLFFLCFHDYLLSKIDVNKVELTFRPFDEIKNKLKVQSGTNN